MPAFTVSSSNDLKHRLSPVTANQRETALLESWGDAASVEETGLAADA